MYIVVQQVVTPEAVAPEISSVLDHIDKFPLTELLVGVVVPIVAAWISYKLVENATKRKEYNRLFIQTELLKRELLKNDNSIIKFTSKYEEKIRYENELKFPLAFGRELLIDVLNKLEKIKSEYIYFNKDILHERPTILYIWAQKIEAIKSEIETEELKLYDDEYLAEKQKILVSQLKEQKQGYINEAQKHQDRNIYNEFLHIQAFIERNTFENIFEKSDIKERNFLILKYFYNTIKEFNSKENKNNTDVGLLYEKLVLFKISKDIIADYQFNQDIFDLNYRGFERHDDFEKSLYDMCENYYKLVALEQFIENYEFDLPCQKWYENSSDLVLLSDSELYISITELYEELKAFQDDYKEKMNDDFKAFYEYCKSITKTISEIIEKMKNHQSKIEKWCKRN